MFRINQRLTGFTLVLGLALLGGCQTTFPRQPGSLQSAFGSDAIINLKESQIADVQVALGRGFENRGEIQQAMATYTTAIEKDPKRADAYVRLAILHDRQGQFDESAKLYDKARQLQPRDADIDANHGYSLYLQQRWPEAEQVLRRAIILQSDHRAAHNNLGLTLGRQGKQQEALDEFQLAGVSRAEAHSNLAYVLTLAQRWPEAFEHYENALAANPDCAKARSGVNQLKLLMTKLNNPSDADRTGAVVVQASANLTEAPTTVLRPE